MEKLKIPGCFINKTIAVIGGAKPQKNRGEDIDNHDVVIRVNCIFYNKNDSAIIGGKTTIHAFSEGAFERNGKKKPCGLKLEIHRKHGELMRKIHKDITDNTPILRPTTGFIVLYMLYYYGIKADAYGFDFYKTKHMYWDEQKESLKKHNRKMYERFNTLKTFLSKSVHNPSEEELFWKEKDWHKFHA